MARTTGIFPNQTGFFPRVKSSKFEGEIQLAHEDNDLALGVTFQQPFKVLLIAVDSE